MGTTSRNMNNKIFGVTQHGFPKEEVKHDLITFYDKMTCLVDEGKILKSQLDMVLDNLFKVALLEQRFRQDLFQRSL